MKILVVRPSSSISTNLTFDVKHLNDLCFLLLELPGATAVLTEFDDQKLFSRCMTSIKSSASYIS